MNDTGETAAEVEQDRDYLRDMLTEAETRAENAETAIEQLRETIQKANEKLVVTRRGLTGVCLVCHYPSAGGGLHENDDCPVAMLEAAFEESK